MPRNETDNGSVLFKRLTVAFWVLEGLQLFIALVTVGLTGSASVGLKHDLAFPSIPTKLGYNIAIASITMIVLLLFVPLDIFASRLPLWREWNERCTPWPRFAISVVFTFLWIGCVASSVYTCDDLCSAAEMDYGFINYASLCCSCATREYNSCGENFDPALTVYEPRSHRYEGTQATDALMLLLFIATSCILLSFHWLKTPTQPRGYPEQVPHSETEYYGGYHLKMPVPAVEVSHGPGFLYTPPI